MRSTEILVNMSSTCTIFHLASAASFIGLAWTVDTFCLSDDAESALCRDRPNFLTRHDIVELIPAAIMKRLSHPGDNAQIEGFQELFVHLNTDPRADKLRKLIVEYFNLSPILCRYLSQSSFRISCDMTHSASVHFGIAEYPGEEPLSFRGNTIDPSEPRASPSLFDDFILNHIDVSTSLSPELGSSAENLVR